MEIIPTCLEQDVSYDWQATALKLSSEHNAVVQTFLWLLTQ